MRNLDLESELRNLKRHKGQVGEFVFAFSNTGDDAKLMVSARKPLQQKEVLTVRKSGGNHYAKGTCSFNGIELTLNISDSKGFNPSIANKKLRSYLLDNGLKYKCKFAH